MKSIQREQQKKPVNNTKPTIPLTITEVNTKTQSETSKTSTSVKTAPMPKLRANTSAPQLTTIPNKSLNNPSPTISTAGLPRQRAHTGGHQLSTTTLHQPPNRSLPPTPQTKITGTPITVNQTSAAMPNNQPSDKRASQLVNALTDYATSSSSAELIQRRLASPIKQEPLISPKQIETEEAILFKIIQQISSEVHKIKIRTSDNQEIDSLKIASQELHTLMQVLSNIKAGNFLSLIAATTKEVNQKTKSREEAKKQHQNHASALLYQVTFEIAEISVIFDEIKQIEVTIKASSQANKILDKTQRHTVLLEYNLTGGISPQSQAKATTQQSTLLKPDKTKVLIEKFEDLANQTTQSVKKIVEKIALNPTEMKAEKLKSLVHSAVAGAPRLELELANNKEEWKPAALADKFQILPLLLADLNRGDNKNLSLIKDMLHEFIMSLTQRQNSLRQKIATNLGILESLEKSDEILEEEICAANKLEERHRHNLQMLNVQRQNIIDRLTDRKQKLAKAKCVQAKILIQFVKDNDVNGLQEYLAAGADINVQDENGQTALHIAAQLNNIKFVEMLLSNKANCNIYNNDGHSPLHQAIIDKADHKLIEYLITNPFHSGKACQVSTIAKDKKQLTARDYLQQYYTNKQINEDYYKLVSSVLNFGDERSQTIYKIIAIKTIQACISMFDNASPGESAKNEMCKFLNGRKQALISDIRAEGLAPDDAQALLRLVDTFYNDIKKYFLTRSKSPQDNQTLPCTSMVQMLSNFYKNINKINAEFKTAILEGNKPASSPSSSAAELTRKKSFSFKGLKLKNRETPLPVEDNTQVDQLRDNLIDSVWAYAYTLFDPNFIACAAKPCSSNIIPPPFAKLLLPEEQKLYPLKLAIIEALLNTKLSEEKQMQIYQNILHCLLAVHRAVRYELTPPKPPATNVNSLQQGIRNPTAIRPIPPVKDTPVGRFTTTPTNNNREQLPKQVIRTNSATTVAALRNRFT